MSNKELNPSQLEVMSDFLKTSTSLQLKIAKFLEEINSSNQSQKTGEAPSRHLLTLKENFAYCGLSDVSVCLGYILNIINHSFFSGFSSNQNFSEAVQQSLDCLIHYIQNLSDNKTVYTGYFYLGTPLLYLSEAKNNEQRDKASNIVLLSIIHEHRLSNVKKDSRILSFNEDSDFTKFFSYDEILSLNFIIEAQENRNDHWVGRTKFQIALALKLNRYMQNACDIRQLILAVCFHDLGMISLSDSLLLKPDGYDSHEREAIKNHIHTSHAFLGFTPDLSEARRMVLEHHEEYDGGGYPNALKGTQICLGAQILMMCDVFYSLTHSRLDRPYQKSALRAILKIKQFSGSKFSNQMISAIVACTDIDFNVSLESEGQISHV